MIERKKKIQDATTIFSLVFCLFFRLDNILESHVDDMKMILFSTLLFILLLKTESKRPDAGKRNNFLA